MCETLEARFFLGRKKKAEIQQAEKAVTEKYISELYDDRKVSRDVQKELHRTLYEPIKEAVNEGFKSLPRMKVEYGTPNAAMLKNLQENAAVFSIFKSHALQKEVFALLKDEQGNLRSKPAFIAEARKVDDKYRVQHLDTEYDTAVRTSRMAAVWAKALESKRIYPNLKYTQSLAAKPRADHANYYGLVRPIDDSFWNTHMPPNGWRCQCGVEPSDDDTTDIPDNLPPPEKGFAFNSGKTGQVFDLDKTDYAKTVTANEKPALVKAAQQLVNTQAVEDAPYQTVYEAKSGTKVLTHPLSYEASDYDQNLAMAKQLANSSLPVEKIEILPFLHNYPQLRTKLLPDAKGSSNPDFRIDGVVCDMKTPSAETAGKNTIKTAMSNAHEQCNGIVLPLGGTDYISAELLYENINSKFSNKAYKDFVMYLRYKDQWQRFDKASWKTFYATQKPR